MNFFTERFYTTVRKWDKYFDSLSGPINGGRCTLHAQDTSTLPLLYDFEELEEEVDFLTRVFSLMFYLALDGEGPITIGGTRNKITLTSFLS